MKLRLPSLTKVAPLLMLFAAAPAFAAENAQTATSVEAPVEGGGGEGICSVCGPAPCCVILWTAWCGCPFGGRDDRLESRADEAPAEELLACRPQVSPPIAPEQGKTL
ncbi:hypothetical protein [Corallococcus sp. Z5C101001]|uniref:hypothetical protein n=1 Tax=Corallococcus sp. Z5C101001 TaxID=2596829 RepID=UPI001180516D|nr:hypothetical protein [Corallococcus sp. Z5C101001]TSC31580.1 hypothetical protein FOF48_13025 [Corallococcus sp. Z5C101001]